MKFTESHVNVTEGYRIWDSEPQDLADTWMGEDAPIGEIFRAFQKEYGRCVSKVYRDTDDGPVAIGWVFQKREKYDDSNETFLREVWITLYDKWEHRIEREYHVIA